MGRVTLGFEAVSVGWMEKGERWCDAGLIFDDSTSFHRFLRGIVVV